MANLDELLKLAQVYNALSAPGQGRMKSAVDLLGVQQQGRQADMMNALRQQGLGLEQQQLAQSGAQNQAQNELNRQQLTQTGNFQQAQLAQALAEAEATKQFRQGQSERELKGLDIQQKGLEKSTIEEQGKNTRNAADIRAQLLGNLMNRPDLPIKDLLGILSTDLNLPQAPVDVRGQELLKSMEEQQKQKQKQPAKPPGWMKSMQSVSPTFLHL